MDFVGLPIFTWRLIYLVPALLIAILVGKAIYNVFFHPLRHIPGPKLFAASHLPYARHHIQGTTISLLQRLHDQYGEVVRFSPDEVSFISIETAVQDIYGFRSGDQKEQLNMPKDPRWYIVPTNDVPSLFAASEENHPRIRRSLAHAFTDRAIKAGEVLLQDYGNLLVTQLESTITTSPEPVDMVAWLDWLTFDVVGEYVFGEPFGCLRNKETQKFVKLLQKDVAASRLHYIQKLYPWTRYLAYLTSHKRETGTHEEFARWVVESTNKYMENEAPNPNFITHVLQRDVIGKELSLQELYSNVGLLLSAGPDTVASLLCGVIFFLCKNPSAYGKLKTEIRGLWNGYEDVDRRTATANAPYLNAVISESFRLFPPVAAGFPRAVPKGGQTISGYFISEGTSVSVTQDVAFTSDRNFRDADKFVPERWMDLPRYRSDHQRWMQPFSYGPRDCIGKKLAYAEARLFLAKMVWAFDFELAPGQDTWTKDGRYLTLRDKPPLMVRVTKAKRAHAVC